MANSKVSWLLARFRRLGFQEVRTLAEMVVVQLLLEGLVSSLGEHRLFLKNGENTHRLYRGKKQQKDASEFILYSEKPVSSKSSVMCKYE